MKNDLIKDPVLKAKLEKIEADPSGNAIAELTEQDLNALAGAGVTAAGLSAFLGNKGRFCTLTKECQPMCN